jgi:hypothetical protein
MYQDQQDQLSVSCEGLLFRVFQQPNALGDRTGSVVALTSPHPGAGVTHITGALLDVLRRDGHASAISLSARQLVCDSGTSTQSSLASALEAIRREYRYALIDCGSMKTSQAAIRLAPLVDGMILVSQANRTQPEQIQYAEKTIEAVNGRILGHVLNKRTYVIPGWFHRMMDGAGI